MPSRRRNYCFAPGCRTGYSRAKGVPKASLFNVPQDVERRKQWERNLHRTTVHLIDGVEVRIPRGRPLLTKDAIPTILPNLPAYLSKKTAKPRKKRKRCESEATTSNSKSQRMPDHDLQESPTLSSSAEAEDLLEKVETFELCVGALDAKGYDPSFFTERLQEQAMKDTTQKMRALNASVTEEALNEQISKLPPKQQESVRQCFLASRVKKRGFHYSKMWILECIIMKMKSARLYDHVRDNEILALPSKSTLKRYMAVYRTAFGFSKKVLEKLKRKTQDMNSFKKHGGLLVDELKLSEHLCVKQSGQIEGFVDLGDYTSAEEKSVQSDHGMVIMFVPFVGKWSQVTMHHVREAFKIDASSLTLKAMPGITKCQLQPNAFEKMRVGLAFQLFADRVLQGLHLYKDEIEARTGTISATQEFFRAVIASFLEYLAAWESHADGAGGFLSESTAVGLRVTLSSTLELLSYLTEEFALPCALIGLFLRSPSPSSSPLPRLPRAITVHAMRSDLPASRVLSLAPTHFTRPRGST
ncbi:hypothetical protein HPB47_021709 [Ixodes persulcatus]|uniref:Uncharacterized protein n=1 Tax=Ixodes persulcatus TaxID=34615 RepID=A0AC60QBR6_IXOPE|nr:hypothetical protein HPB47_021709 [Ixodes persulcatus]